MHEALASHTGTCQKLLDAAVEAAPARSPSNSERLVDLALLLAAGAWFHGVWGLGVAGGSGGISGGAVSLLPAQYAGLERALAVVLLLAMLVRFVMVRTA
jgi:hypothetical protein